MATAQSSTQPTAFLCTGDFAKHPLASLLLTSPGEPSNEVTDLRMETSALGSPITPSLLKADQDDTAQHPVLTGA